jgi:hypothetical protein
MPAARLSGTASPSEVTGRCCVARYWLNPSMCVSNSRADSADAGMRLPAATIREIVAGIDKKQLAMALRGANDEMRAQVFKAMSSRAVEMLKEDMEVLGPVRSREVAQAQQEILNLARRLEAEGKVVLKLETGDEMLA